MTKEDIVGMVENRGEFVHKQGELYSSGYLIDDESMDKISEAILRRQDDRLKEFIELEKKKLDERFAAEERSAATEEDGEYRAYHEGILSGLMYAHDWLDSDFKEFIEADDKKDA